tara:strand:- start:221 stop:796 length:576 start_codon:yes stop_codon:yes gene_type:complete
MPDGARHKLRFWEFTSDENQKLFFSNMPGRQLRGYKIAQELTTDFYPDWNEQNDTAQYSGALIDPAYTSTEDQNLFFRENLSQQFRSYNIANGVMADYYDGNDVPVVTQPPNATLDYGENYSYTISVSDVDSSLSYSLISNLSWLGISGNVISGTASSPGTSTVTIRVSDGTVNVDKSFTITVNQDDAISS